MMKCTQSGLVALFVLFSLGAHAAQMISKEEAKHYKLQPVGTIAIDTTGKNFTMPSELQAEISKQADKRGGKYYVITSVREEGEGLSGTVTVYK